MKIRSLISVSLLVSALLTGLGPAHAEQQRAFGFAGEINSFDRNNNVLVIDDLVFRISDRVRVYKKKGQTATLSEIGPGVMVGFYPASREGSEQGSYIDAMWVLPASWNGKRGYSDKFED